MTSVRCAAAVVAALFVHLAPAAPPPDNPGRAIYEDGVGASGEPVRATVQQGVVLSGRDAACVNCHRRSGLGGSEGQNSVRPIAGRVLFSPTASLAGRGRASSGALPSRPAYDRESLARALREGVDPAGRVLDALMPRYPFGDDEVAHLHAYLSTLSADTAPGVDGQDIHFATIVTPGVDEADRSAMRDVLQRFVDDKNAETRGEARRRGSNSERMYRAHRNWVLHMWELDGAPETWGEQLAARYQAQPVFAVFGGLGRGTWEPVHAFCEAARVPCVFADVDHPGRDGYYSVYFSRGIALEAAVIAKQLAASAGRGGHIVQVFRDSLEGRLAAQALRAALQRQGIEPIDHILKNPPSFGAGDWRALLVGGAPTTLVLWLDPAELRVGESDAGPPETLSAVYVSASLARLLPPQLPAPWRDKLRIVSPFVLPRDRDRHLMRLRAWLAARKIPLAAPRAQANAFFAASVTADAIAHLGENFSRDYFLERVEQMAESPVFASMYPHLSLGPGQRYASRGAYILGFPGGPDAPLQPLMDWTVP